MKKIYYTKIKQISHALLFLISLFLTSSFLFLLVISESVIGAIVLGIFGIALEVLKVALIALIKGFSFKKFTLYKRVVHISVLLFILGVSFLASTVSVVSVIGDKLIAQSETTNTANNRSALSIQEEDRQISSLLIKIEENQQTLSDFRAEERELNTFKRNLDQSLITLQSTFYETDEENEVKASVIAQTREAIATTNFSLERVRGEIETLETLIISLQDERQSLLTQTTEIVPQEAEIVVGNQSSASKAIAILSSQFGFSSFSLILVLLISFIIALEILLILTSSPLEKTVTPKSSKPRKKSAPKKPAPKKPAPEPLLPSQMLQLMQIAIENLGDNGALPDLTFLQSELGLELGEVRELCHQLSKLTLGEQPLLKTVENKYHFFTYDRKILKDVLGVLAREA